MKLRQHILWVIVDKVTSLVIGVNPEKLAGTWFTQGRFLAQNDGLKAVVGDTVANTMYSVDRSKGITDIQCLR